MASRQLDEEAIFHVARSIESSEMRSTYLDQVCASEQALREQFFSLRRDGAQAREHFKEWRIAS